MSAGHATVAGPGTVAPAAAPAQTSACPAAEPPPGTDPSEVGPAPRVTWSRGTSWRPGWARCARLALWLLGLVVCTGLISVAGAVLTPAPASAKVVAPSGGGGSSTSQGSGSTQTPTKVNGPPTNSTSGGANTKGAGPSSRTNPNSGSTQPTPVTVTPPGKTQDSTPVNTGTGGTGTGTGTGGTPKPVGQAPPKATPQYQSTTPKPVVQSKPVVQKPVTNPAPVVKSVQGARLCTANGGSAADCAKLQPTPTAQPKPVVQKPVANPPAVVQKPVTKPAPVVQKPVANPAPVVKSVPGARLCTANGGSAADCAKMAPAPTVQSTTGGGTGTGTLGAGVKKDYLTTQFKGQLPSTQPQPQAPTLVRSAQGYRLCTANGGSAADCAKLQPTATTVDSKAWLAAHNLDASGHPVVTPGGTGATGQGPVAGGGFCHTAGCSAALNKPTTVDSKAWLAAHNLDANGHPIPPVVVAPFDVKGWQAAHNLDANGHPIPIPPAKNYPGYSKAFGGSWVNVNDPITQGLTKTQQAAQDKMNKDAQIQAANAAANAFRKQGYNVTVTVDSAGHPHVTFTVANAGDFPGAKFDALVTQYQTAAFNKANRDYQSKLYTAMDQVKGLAILPGESQDQYQQRVLAAATQIMGGANPATVLAAANAQARLAGKNGFSVSGTDQLTTAQVQAMWAQAITDQAVISAQATKANSNPAFNPKGDTIGYTTLSGPAPVLTPGEVLPGPGQPMTAEQLLSATRYIRTWADLKKALPANLSNQVLLDHLGGFNLSPAEAAKAQAELSGQVNSTAWRASIRDVHRAQDAMLQHPGDQTYIDAYHAAQATYQGVAPRPPDWANALQPTPGAAEYAAYQFALAMNPGVSPPTSGARYTVPTDWTTATPQAVMNFTNGAATSLGTTPAAVATNVAYWADDARRALTGAPTSPRWTPQPVGNGLTETPYQVSLRNSPFVLGTAEMVHQTVTDPFNPNLVPTPPGFSLNPADPTGARHNAAVGQSWQGVLRDPGALFRPGSPLNWHNSNNVYTKDPGGAALRDVSSLLLVFGLGRDVVGGGRTAAVDAARTALPTDALPTDTTPTDLGPAGWRWPRASGPAGRPLTLRAARAITGLDTVGGLRPTSTTGGALDLTRGGGTPTVTAQLSGPSTVVGESVTGSRPVTPPGELARATTTGGATADASSTGGVAATHPGSAWAGLPEPPPGQASHQVWLDTVKALRPVLAKMTPAELRAYADQVRYQTGLAQGALRDRTQVQAFALAEEMNRRGLAGQAPTPTPALVPATSWAQALGRAVGAAKTAVTDRATPVGPNSAVASAASTMPVPGAGGFALHDVQLLAGRVVSHGATMSDVIHTLSADGTAGLPSRGVIAQMLTGEGKTYVEQLALTEHALNPASSGVHAMTSDVALAARDAAAYQQVAGQLGISVGQLADGQSRAARAAAYRADTTFGTAAQFVHNALYDAQHPLAPRAAAGGDFVMVGEADALLVDQAATPYILATGRGGPAAAAAAAGLVTRAHNIAAGLAPTTDFTTDPVTRSVTLTEQAAATVAAAAARATAALFDQVHQSLVAQHLLSRDVHYIVDRGQPVIVDNFTGRRMDGRQWQNGLHQAVQANEGLPITPPQRTLAQMTMDQYLTRYPQVTGTTGTAVAAAQPLGHIYGLGVAEIPPNLPSARVTVPDAHYATVDAQRAGILADATTRAAAGQPVLINTPTIRGSIDLANYFRAAGVDVQVLNAHPDYASTEAAVVARAGQPGVITIATNMMARGTDLKLGDPAGPGLHVIGTERSTSTRVDQQLLGRTARQGQPGSSQFHLPVAGDPLLGAYADPGAYTQALTDAAHGQLDHATLTGLFDQAQTTATAVATAGLYRTLGITPLGGYGPRAPPTTTAGTTTAGTTTAGTTAAGTTAAGTTTAGTTTAGTTTVAGAMTVAGATGFTPPVREPALLMDPAGAGQPPGASIGGTAQPAVPGTEIPAAVRDLPAQVAQSLAARQAAQSTPPAAAAKAGTAAGATSSSGEVAPSRGAPMRVVLAAQGRAGELGPSRAAQAFGSWKAATKSAGQIQRADGQRAGALTTVTRVGDATALVSLSQLPPQVLSVLEAVRAGDITHTRSGEIFDNTQGRLPTQPRGYYRAFTVAPAGQPRGARRLVLGAAGEAYYTDDHYRSFARITNATPASLTRPSPPASPRVGTEQPVAFGDARGRVVDAAGGGAPRAAPARGNDAAPLTRPASASVSAGEVVGVDKRGRPLVRVALSQEAQLNPAPPLRPGRSQVANWAGHLLSRVTGGPGRGRAQVDQQSTQQQLAGLRTGLLAPQQLAGSSLRPTPATTRRPCPPTPPSSPTRRTWAAAGLGCGGAGG